MRKRNQKILRIGVWVLLMVIGGVVEVSGQAPCGPDTPWFPVDLSNDPAGSWTSPPVVRDDQCCDVLPPDVCVSFTVQLSPQSQGINFEIISGGVPPGALFYQIDCGPPIAVGQPICIQGTGSVDITFCKPGNNANTYSITSIPAVIATQELTARVGCTNYELNVTGPTVSTIQWNSIFPGAPGQYNSLLSCTSGCGTSFFTPNASTPALVQYQVCGSVTSTLCASTFTVCDTIDVTVIPPLNVTVTPSPANFCIDGIQTLVATTNNG
jgi:hypothetical protein